MFIEHCHLEIAERRELKNLDLVMMQKLWRLEGMRDIMREVRKDVMFMKEVNNATIVEEDKEVR